MACTDEQTGQLIGSYELGLLSEQERKSFEAHVLKCDHCFQDLYRTAPVISTMKAENGANIPAGAGRRRWRSWSVMLGTAAAAVLLLVYVAGTLDSGESQERLRGIDDGSVVVFAPIAEVPRPTELDWKVVPQSTSYEITLATAAGELIWKTTAQTPPVVLPESVRKRLMPGKSYIWQVAALGDDGRSWASPKTTFTVWG